MTGAWYIALEGAEGCGKSTHAARLAAALGAVLTRETGGTPIGERVRSILHDPANTDLTARAEALLIAADRAQHARTVVHPALQAGHHVVSDRSVHSTLAYQGYGRGLDLAELTSINDWALCGRWPDLVVLLDVPPHQLRQRMRGRQLDRFERESTTFHSRVRDAFRSMAAADPARWVVVDGSHETDAVSAAIRAAIRERLGV